MISRVEYNKFTNEYFITVPDDIIEALGLEAGDQLVWEVVGDKIFVSKKQ